MMALDSPDPGPPSSTRWTAVGVRGFSQSHGTRGETWKPMEASEGARSFVKDQGHRVTAGTQRPLFMLGTRGRLPLRASAVCGKA